MHLATRPSDRLHRMAPFAEDQAQRAGEDHSAAEDGGEIEIDPGLKVPVTPVLKSALRAVEGVLEIEEV